MKQLRTVVAIASLLIGLALQASAKTPLSIAEYRMQLQRIADQVRSVGDYPEQAPSVIAAIPDEVSVHSNSGDVDVSYRTLKDALTEYTTANDKLKRSRLQAINAYVEALEINAAAVEGSSEQSASARAKLSEILSRREFRTVHGPGLKETLLARLYRWIARILERLHFGSGGAFTLLQVFVYTLIAAALMLLLLWTIRRLRRKEQEFPAREVIPFAPSAKSWRAWLEEARDRASRNDWRSAIHLGYWAGISFLESGGAWKPNRARTPREYVRLLSSRNPSHAPLTALTRKFEVVWYGDRPAGPQDFQETLGHLEKLGCR
jgi:Domain of unknown function (DUF4129)